MKAYCINCKDYEEVVLKKTGYCSATVDIVCSVCHWILIALSDVEDTIKPEALK